MTTILAGEKFTSTEEAFQFFIDTIYPNLSSEEIKKTKVIVSRFKHGYSITEGKLEEVLKEYGNARIEKITKIFFD